MLCYITGRTMQLSIRRKSVNVKALSIQNRESEVSAMKTGIFLSKKKKKQIMDHQIYLKLSGI